MEHSIQPPPTNPFGSDRGTALDVIVIVPPPPFIASKRRRRHRPNESPETELSTTLESSCNHFNGVVSSDSLHSKYNDKTISSSLEYPPDSLDKSTSKQEQPAKGVIASSDFYVSFPSSALSSTLLSNSTPSASFLSVSKSKKFSSFFSRNSSLSGSSIDSAGGSGNKNSDTPKYGKDDDGRSSCADGNKEEFQVIKKKKKISNQVPANQQFTSNRKSNVQIRINGRYVPELDMIFSKKGGGNGSDSADSTSCRFMNGNGLRPPTETLYMLIGKEVGSTRAKYNIPPSLSQQYPGSDTIITPILNYGRNLIRYTLVDKNGTVVATAEAYLYLWSACDSVIVCDVDGTVTKSDIRGVIDSVIQDKFQHIHTGICKFFHDLLAVRSLKEGDYKETSEEGYDQDGRDVSLRSDEEEPSKPNNIGEIRFLYLSSRPISIISQTRKLLVSVSQIHLENVSSEGVATSKTNGDGLAKRYSLPPGPILCHTGSLSSVLFAELVAKNVFEFKADVLARQVVLPFVAARGEEWKFFIRNHNISSKGFKSSFRWDDRLFLAGFGNKVTDAIGYEMAGMDRRDIYIINKDSKIICMENDALSERGMSDSELSRMNQLSGSSGSAFDDVEWSPDVSFCIGEESLIALKQSGSCNDSIYQMHRSYCHFPSDDHEIELSLSEEPQNSSSDGISFANHTVGVCISPKAQRIERIDSVNKESKRKSKKNLSRRSIKQSIRAFSSKKSLNKFPSFASTSSNEQTPSQKEFYEGYSDARLLHAVRKRMVR
ncbi:hypothetical protein ACHAXS_013491 [Conticribra weissflogii]